MPKLTVKQLKRLVREAIDEIDPSELDRKAKYVDTISDKDDLISLYSDMYKELYNIRPRWIRSENVSEEQLRALIAHLEEIYPREMEQRKREAEEEERYFEKLSKKFEDEDKRAEDAKKELGSLGYEDLEDLPKRSGMRRRLGESLKTIVREAIKSTR